MSVLSLDNPCTSLGLPRIPAFLKAVFNATTGNDEPINWLDKSSYFSSGDDHYQNETFPGAFFGSPVHKKIRAFCEQLLLERISDSSLRYWDVAILIPNLLFLLLLIIKLRHIRQRLRQINNPVFQAFVILVYLATFLNITLFLSSIYIGSTNQSGHLLDKVLWLLLKFLLLSTELCVLSFGLLSGCIQSRAGVGIIFALSVFLSSVHVVAQAVIEFVVRDERQATGDAAVLEFAVHGGLGFWIISSGVFVIIYSLIGLFPYTCVRRCFTLPGQCSFYAYCIVMAILNALQMFGAALLLIDCLDGICIVDLTSFLYFTLYIPLVYLVFLRRSLNMSKIDGGEPFFSYEKHKNETGFGDLPDASTYYPRFSGLTSPSYDDLFDCDNTRTRWFMDPIQFNDFCQRNDADQARGSNTFDSELPLATSIRTPDSTTTTHLDYDYSPDNGKPPLEVEERLLSMKPSEYDVGGSTSFGTAPRHLRGLGPNGTLIFSEDPILHPKI